MHSIALQAQWAIGEQYPAILTISTAIICFPQLLKTWSACKKLMKIFHKTDITTVGLAQMLKRNFGIRYVDSIRSARVPWPQHQHSAYCIISRTAPIKCLELESAKTLSNLER